MRNPHHSIRPVTRQNTICLTSFDALIANNWYPITSASWYTVFNHNNRNNYHSGDIAYATIKTLSATHFERII